MDNSEKLANAYSKLGADSSATRDQILSRTKTLIAEVGMGTNDSESLSEISKIIEASNIIISEMDMNPIANYDDLTKTQNHEEELTEPKEPNEDSPNDGIELNDFSAESLSKQEHPRPILEVLRTSFSNHRKTWVISIIVSLIIIGIAVPLSITISRENRYESVLALIGEFDRDNMEMIGEILESLPYDYKERQLLKEQYSYVMNQVFILETNDIMQDYSVHLDAYSALVLFDSSNYRWSLGAYLDGIESQFLILENKYDGIKTMMENFAYYMSIFSNEIIAMPDDYPGMEAIINQNEFLWKNRF